jgi:hypothetical protein
MSKFQGAMRRVITGDNAQGQSVVIIDGGPSSEKGNPDLGEMFEIWEDAAFGPLTPSANEDLGPSGYRHCPCAGRCEKYPALCFDYPNGRRGGGKWRASTIRLFELEFLACHGPQPCNVQDAALREFDDLGRDQARGGVVFVAETQLCAHAL